MALKKSVGRTRTCGCSPKEPEHIRLEFSDDGIGMPNEAQQRGG